jgi:hypothetical protein
MRLDRWALLPCLFAAIGCTGTVSGSPEAADAESMSTTSAIVVVERTTDMTQGSSAEASARFVRVTAPASAQDALRAIGATLNLPARGSCASLASLEGPVKAGGWASGAPVVELIDVGAVSLEVGGEQTRLLPRQLPDVTDVVSGVVYARATDPALLPASTRYVVHVGGGHDLAPVDVEATAPAEPSEVRITGETPQGVVVAAGPWVSFAWTAGANDLVYVDVRPNGPRCVFDEVGAAAIPTSSFDSAGTLVVHRVRQERLPVRGIDTSEVRFDFARTVAYVRP